MNARTPTLYPVILPVPSDKRMLKGRAKVTFLSLHARCALALSAGKMGAAPDAWPKNDDGVPLPVEGVHWSVTHKSGYVAGVAAPFPVGIDVETIRPCTPSLFDRIAEASEWDIAGDRSFQTFFRYWTAKEAVLKATGEGIRGLSTCRIRRIVDATHLVIHYRHREWDIEQRMFDRHIASATRNGADLQWIVVPRGESPDPSASDGCD